MTWLIVNIFEPPSVEIGTFLSAVYFSILILLCIFSIAYPTNHDSSNRKAFFDGWAKPERIIFK
jgi:hypothetical protein